MTYFRQIYDQGLAQAAYIIGDAGQALVVDPLRDIDIYLDHIARRGLRLVGIVETHIHADFLSGGRELAHATGAPLYISGETDPDWQYEGLEALEVMELNDQDTFRVGAVEIQALHTPGHTPEHLCLVLTDTSRSDEPMMVLTGDFLFVGDLGRPDLLEKSAGQADSTKPGARQVFASLRLPFASLGDDLALWPGHGAGSACGKAPGDIPSSTVGFERRASWWSDYLDDGDEKGFVDHLLTSQPEKPTYYDTMKVLNRDGPRILGELPSPPRLTPGRFRDLVDENTTLLDLRDFHSFCRSHIPKAINFSSLLNLSNHAGWLIPYDTPVALICHPTQVQEATRRLIRIGIDDIIGFAPVDQLHQYAPAELDHYPIITAEQAHYKWTRSGFEVVDVRSQSEHESGHIPDAIHIHYGKLPHRLDQLPEDKTLIVHCAPGVRANVAASYLAGHGFDDVLLFPDGLQGWTHKDYPINEP